MAPTVKREVREWATVSDDEDQRDEYAISFVTFLRRDTDEHAVKKIKVNPEGFLCDECQKAEIENDVAFQCVDCGEFIVHAKCLGFLQGCNSDAWWCRRCRGKASKA